MPLNALNVLLVIADDLGVEKLACYGAQTHQPPTPQLTAIANFGVRFDAFWTMPACSHTRSALDTDRYGFRTGVLGVIDTDLEAPLPANEIIIPRALELASPGQYDTALIGKWHLSNAQNGSWIAPNAFGFKTFIGSKGNIRSDGGPGYFDWNRSVNGRVARSTTYNTTQTTDDALTWINGHASTQNWFCQVAYAAPHNPFDRPTAALYSAAAYASLGLGLPYPLADATAPSGQEAAYEHAMIQAWDTELGRLWANITPAIKAQTLLLVVSDNGTTPIAVTSPFNPDHGKSSIYELAVRNALVASGFGVASPGRVYSGLVNAVDVGETVLNAFGTSFASVLPKGRTSDGISFSNVLASAGGSSARASNFSEQYSSDTKYPVGGVPNQILKRAVRNGQHKLLVEWLVTGQRKPDELYDLSVDPQETNNLLVTAPTDPAVVAAYASLQATLAALAATV